MMDNKCCKCCCDRCRKCGLLFTYPLDDKYKYKCYILERLEYAAKCVAEEVRRNTPE